jgi:hypothetical protein
MNDTPNIPKSIQALSILSGVAAEEVTVQVASLLAAIGGPHAGLMTLGDEFQPVGFHLLHLGGGSARQRRLTQLLFQPLRFLQEDLLAYSRLAPGKQLDLMARAYVGGRRSDEHLSVDPVSEVVEGIARRDVYHLADLSSGASSLTSPWRRREDVDLFMDPIGRTTLLPVDGIHRHLPGYPMLSQSAVGRQEGRCLQEPVVFLDNPRADALKKPWEGVDRDSPLILDESGRLWEDACQSASGRETLHRILRERAFVNPAAAGKDRHRSGCSRLFSIVTEELGRQLLSQPEIDGLLASQLLTGTSSEERSTVCDINPEDVSAGYRSYRNTVRDLMRLRRLDALGLWWIGVKDEVAIQLHQGQREFIHQLETVDTASRAFGAGFSNLPVTFLWTLAQLEPTKDVTGEMVSNALALSETAMRNHLAVIRELRRDTETVRVERKAAEMLWKLLEVEPCTFRELMRKYPVQRRDVHEPVLNHLVESGKVLRREDNKLRLTDEARAELGESSTEAKLIA